MYICIVRTFKVLCMSTLSTCVHSCSALYCYSSACYMYTVHACVYYVRGGGGGSPALFLHVHVDVAVRGFVNIVSNRATGFHRQTKLFELNFFKKKTFPLAAQTRRENHSQSQLICPVPGRL